jgi:signal transduction histidine kinase
MPLRSLLVAFFLSIACFFGSTLYSQRTSRAIDEAANSIATNAMPSIQRLSSARAELRKLATDVQRHTSPEDKAGRQAILDDRTHVDEEVDRYLELPAYPGEREHQRQLDHNLAQIDRAVGALLARIDGQTVAIESPLRDESNKAIEQTIVHLRSLIDFNAAHAADQAEEIARARIRSDRTALGLDAMSALLTLIVAFLVVRLLRHYERVLEERNRLIETRAEALEQFAGRVAHDVLGPLSATSVAIQLALRRVGDDQTKETLGRGARGVTRVQTIVDGLLRFARAGARPEPGVATPIRPVIEEVIAEMQPLAAESDVKLTAEGICDASVTGNPGVVTSLIENLVRNAIKYMLNARERRVTVRSMLTNGCVRVEVQDTGPGIAPELLPRVFQPYVRGADTGKPGIGLGLATVRRIVEAHGGTVGVTSSPSGSLFWFELPRVTASAAQLEQTAPPPALN